MTNHLVSISKVCALGLGILTLLCATAFAGPLKKVRMQLDWYPDAETGGYICAQVMGYYKEAGLDVQIIPDSPSTNPINTVVYGSADFSMADVDQVMLARSTGIPIVSVMATMQHDPQGVMVHADSPVKSFADLEGHAIAITPGSIWFTYITKKFNLKNIQELRLSFTVANFMVDPNYIQQVFITTEPYICLEHGVKVRTLLIMDTGCDPYRVAITRDQFLKDNPEVVKAFVAASIKGWKTYISDPAKTDAEIKRLNPGMTQNLLDYARNALISGHFIDGFSARGDAVGKMDPARITSQYKILRDLDIIKSDYDYRGSFTTDFCNAPPEK